jgi:hypothetical protein
MIGFRTVTHRKCAAALVIQLVEGVVRLRDLENRVGEDGELEPELQEQLDDIAMAESVPDVQHAEEPVMEVSGGSETACQERTMVRLCNRHPTPTPTPTPRRGRTVPL